MKIILKNLKRQSMIILGEVIITDNQIKTKKMNESTLEKMRKMNLFGMYRVFKTSIESGKTDNYTPDEMISSLIDSEWDDRKNRGIERLLRNAHFRYKASVEELLFDAERNIDKNQILRFADCSFINKYENILITGSTGIGKSFIGTAIGHQACCLGYKVYYQSTPK